MSNIFGMRRKYVKIGRQRRNKFEGKKARESDSKRWNIFVDDYYKTNFFLDFEKPSLAVKFNKDNFIRMLYTVKSFIAVFFIISIVDNITKEYWNVGIHTIATAILYLSAFYCSSAKYTRFHVRVLMAIPLLVIQLTLLRQYKTGLFISMLPTLVIDIMTLYSWRLHIISSMLQTMLILFLSSINAISLKNDIIIQSLSGNFNEILNPVHQKPHSVSIFEFLGFSSSYLAFSVVLLYIILMQTFMFSVIEKLMKEHWVIRETAEKSFRTYFNIFDDLQTEVIFVDSNLKLLWANKRFQNTIFKL
jgi:hypothetical protein